MSLLALDGIACLRGGRLLFEGVSLTLSPGEAIELVGPNGAGKSSLLRIAAGLLRPSAGRVARGRLAWLGEAAALDPERTVAAALAFWTRLDGADGAAREGAMAAMGIAHLAEVPVRYLSTGQRRRAAIARTIAGGAPLWLLDEPANGLDADGTALLARAMAAHRAAGGAILAATHLPLGLAEAGRLTLGAVPA